MRSWMPCFLVCWAFSSLCGCAAPFRVKSTTKLGKDFEMAVYETTPKGKTNPKFAMRARRVRPSAISDCLRAAEGTLQKGNFSQVFATAEDIERLTTTLAAAVSETGWVTLHNRYSVFGSVTLLFKVYERTPHTLTCTYGGTVEGVSHKELIELPSQALPAPTPSPAEQTPTGPQCEMNSDCAAGEHCGDGQCTGS